MALSPGHAKWTDALNQENVFDGAYSRVVALDEGRVLKASCCPVTQKLLSELAKVQARQELALPGVVQRLGVIATDTDNMRYHAWVLERLFTAQDKDAQRLCRVLFRKEFGSIKAAYQQKLAQTTQSKLQELTQNFASVQKCWGQEGNWRASREIALHMTLCTSGVFQATFAFLLDFIERHEVSLDLLTQGNILVNMFGQACLADPVCERDDSLTKPLPDQGLCVTVMVPVAVNGFEVQLEPKSTLPMSAPERQVIVQALQEQGVRAQEVVWGSPAHSQFMRQGSLRKRVWEFPGVAKKLQENAYMQVLLA